MKKTNILIMSPLLAAALLSACSLFHGDSPEPLPDIYLLAEPKIPCDIAGPATTCYWRSQATLTQKNYVVRYHTLEPNVDLVIGDSLQMFTLGHLYEEEVPLEEGRRYTFEADLIPRFTIGFPSIRIRDEAGLVFFATSTLQYEAAGDSILLAPEGWRFIPEPGRFESQNVFCNARARPYALRVEHEGEHIRLVQGETKRLGRYTVTCRIARKMDFSDVNCLDFNAPELSLVIYRTPAG